MNSFLKKSIMFLTPLFLLFVIVEVFVIHHPNTFNLKHDFIENNKDNVEILILGSSETQNSINPEYLTPISANMAYGSQDYQLNNALFKKYLPVLKNLKIVILELDYISLINKNEKDYFRYPWYSKYYDIEIENLSIIDRNLMYPSSTNFFNNYILNSLSPFSYKYVFNKYGFILNDYPGKFEDLNYDEDLIRSSIKKKHLDVAIGLSNYSLNATKIDSIINSSLKKSLEVIIVKNPVYKTYMNNYNPMLNLLRNKFLDSLLIQNPGIKVFDMENDDLFKVEDFKNENHLNTKGANKFTKRLNNFISENI